MPGALPAKVWPNPGLAGIYRALAEHEKRQEYPEAAEAAQAAFAALWTG
ncbi:hypothetical protein ACFYM0_03000 [Streptomyces sp. NPDC006487]